MDESRHRKRPTEDYFNWNAALLHHQMKEQTTLSASAKIAMLAYERDVAIEERDVALAEKKSAVAERDAAIRQRDAAVAERDAVVRQRENAMAALRFQETAASCRARRSRKHRLSDDSGVAFDRSLMDSVTKPARKATTKKKKKKKDDADGDFGSTKLMIGFDKWAVPAPVCSCTGEPKRCYKWGGGGWQSSCCTSSLSAHPLPEVPNKRYARVVGRKMRGSVFVRLLERLVSDGHDPSVPLDLKTHWGKHGANRHVAVK